MYNPKLSQEKNKNLLIDLYNQDSSREFKRKINFKIESEGIGLLKNQK